MASRAAPRWLVASALALALQGAAPTALAQTSGSAKEKIGPSEADKAAAMRKYEEGSRAFSQKRYKDAIDLFLEADSVVQHADLAYNAALAYDAMGDASSALSWAREYLRRAPEAKDRAGVEARIDALEQRLQKKGVQQVTVVSTPPGATVLVDEKPVGVTPWTGDLRPGSHRLDLRLPGHQDRQQTFDLRPERALDVSVELLVAEQAAPTPAAPTPSVSAPGPEVTEDVGVSPLTPLGITVFLLGAGACGAAIGLEVARGAAESDAVAAELQVDVPGHIQRMEDYQLGARIAVGVGGGLALAGGVMLIVGLASGGSEPAAPAASAWCDAEGCSLSVGGRF